MGVSRTAIVATATASCCSAGTKFGGGILRRDKSWTSARSPACRVSRSPFHEDRDPPLHAMPPGGFRLAIINGWDLEVGLAARNRLRMYFLRSCGMPSAETAVDPELRQLLARDTAGKHYSSSMRATDAVGNVVVP
jgi:hypothetical protein